MWVVGCVEWFFRQVKFSLSKLLSTPYDSLAFIKSTFLVNLSLPFIICSLLIILISLIDVSILVGMPTPANLAYQLVNLADPL
jgi:hypothetical protein